MRVILANRIREARDTARLTVRELARRIGRPHSYVVDIEHGHRRLAVSELWAIARATGWSVERLVRPPHDEDEREDWAWALQEFKQGVAPTPRNRQGKRRAPRRSTSSHPPHK